MAPRTTYSSLPDGLSPLSQWDASLADMGRLGITPCTPAGTNAIVLTPIVAVFAPNVGTPQQNQRFSFVAAANSTNSVTVQVGSLAAKALFKGDGVTQAGSGDIVSGVTYDIAYNGSAFQILSPSQAFGLTTSSFAANVIDTDGTLAANSDTRLATQKATKTYVDTSARSGRAVYETVAVATAATIPTSVTSIVIVRYAAGYQASYATYIPGTISGPGAFLEAGGHYWQLDLTGGTVDPRWFGAKGDGINDDTTALQAALTQAVGGKQLLIPPGTWGISASLNGGAGGVRIFGAGKSKSIIQVLAANVVDPMLYFTDSSDVIVEDIDWRGNGVTVVIGAMQFLVTAGSNVIGNYTVQRNAFSNLKAQYWIRFLTNVASTSHTRRMRNIRVLNNDWSAPTSLAPDFTSVGIPAMMLALQGSVDNNGSYIDDVIIANNYADCSGVKGFLTCWAGSKNVIVRDNFILNAGSLGQNDRGCYALLAYNNQASADVTYSPMDILITGNYIISARSMGFYGATAFRVTLTNNTISGVQDTTAASLPYAAISLGQCEDSKANFNELNDNYVSIQAIPTPTSVTMEVVGNKIKTSVANAIGIRSTVAGGTFTNKVKITDNQIIMSGSASAGINASSVGAGFEYDKLDIIGNRVSSLGTGILCNDSSGGGIRANQVTVQDNHIEGAFVTSAIDVQSAVAKTLVLGGSINLVSAGALALGLVATSAPTVHIDGLQIMNRATGTAFAFSAAGANGSMKNVNLIGIARANLPADASTHMGFVLPAVAATGIGQFIQNLATTSYTPAGAGGSQYTIDGWIFSTGTTWYPRRCLTGT